MGFETQKNGDEFPPNLTIMKQSLWDLKLNMENWLKMGTNHEAVPMGFETEVKGKRHDIRTNHEAVPMGFETVWSLDRV